MTIILYDLCWSPPGKGISTNVWKTRYCLNFKNIPHKTEWIEGPDIQSLYEKHNIAPLTNGDGTPLYSVPLIYDPATNAYIADSFAIAEYLDRTYPSPPLFPHATQALQHLFEGAFRHLVFSASQLHYVPEMERSSARNAAFFTPKLQVIFGGGAGVPRDVLWGQFRDGLGRAAEWFNKTDGPFLIGDTLSWADFVVASHLLWFRIILGKESGEWREITSCDGGRWGLLMSLVRKYEAIP